MKKVQLRSLYRDIPVSFSDLSILIAYCRVTPYRCDALTGFTHVYEVETA